MKIFFTVAVFSFLILINTDVAYSQSSATNFRKNRIESLPELKFRFEKDLATFLDTVKINVILGSISSPVDSIYDLSFSCWINHLNNHNDPMNSYYSINTTSFGDTSQNLNANFSYSDSFPPTMSMALNRTDHLNAIISGDTICALYFIVPSSTHYLNPLTLNFNWSAMTEAGFPITLYVTSDSLYLFGTTGINYLSSDQIKFFPNPANDNLNIFFDSGIIHELDLFDETGRKIRTVINPLNKYTLNVKDLAEGIYYISILTSEGSMRSKFLILH